MRFFNPVEQSESFAHDAARAAYQKHVDLVAPKLPPALLSLARGNLNLQESTVRLCTFDAARDQVRLVLRLHAGDAEQTVELVYEGVDPDGLDVVMLQRFATHPATELLYDEVDVLDNGAYAHRIRFAHVDEAGELELRFSRFVARPGPWPLPNAEPEDRFIQK